MAIPIHCLEFSISWPRIHAIIAAVTGINAENMLDFATPRFFIVLTHREKARLEHKMARQIIGYQTSAER